MVTHRLLWMRCLFSFRSWESPPMRWGLLCSTSRNMGLERSHQEGLPDALPVVLMKELPQGMTHRRRLSEKSPSHQRRRPISPRVHRLFERMLVTALKPHPVMQPNAIVEEAAVEARDGVVLPMLPEETSTTASHETAAVGDNSSETAIGKPSPSGQQPSRNQVNVIHNR